MPLYLLKRLDDGGSDIWDKHHGFVVRAPSEFAARELSNANNDAKDERVWHDPTLTSCTEIPHEGAEEIILTDFLKG